MGDFSLFQEIKNTEKMRQITAVLENLKQKGFRKQDSIHTKESVRLARELSFDGRVVQWMEQGLQIDIDMPTGTKYEESNNVSFKKNEKHIWPQLGKWIKEGKVEELDRKPDIINPLSIVSKQDGVTKEWKYRVVIDQSRLVNKRIEDKKTKLDHLTIIEKSIEQNMYMTSWDFTQMYHQIRLTEQTAEFFCFKCKDKVTKKDR